MAVIHFELVLFLVVAMILNTINRVYPIGEAILRGITVYGMAGSYHKGDVTGYVAKRGKMTVDEARRSAEAIVDKHKHPISEALPAFEARGAENLSLLVFSALVTLAVSSISGLWSCMRGTSQHEMSFVALAVCLATAAYLMLARALASSGGTRAAERDQALLRQVGLGAGAVGVVIALLALLAPDSVFDFSLRRGLNEAAAKSTTFLTLVFEAGSGGDGGDAPGLGQRVQQPWLPIVYFSLAVACGAVTYTQVVPAILYSRSLALQLRDEAVAQWRKSTLLVAFVAPLLLAALWVRPVLGNSLLPTDLVKCDAASLARDCTALPHAGEFFLTETQWFSARVAGVLVICGLHLVVTRWHMEAHMKRGREDQVRTLVEYVSVPESSINPEFKLDAELKRLASEPFQNINLVALSMLAPFVALTMLALVSVRKGELTSLHVCPALQSSLGAVGLDPTFMAVPAEARNNLADVDRLLLQALATAFPRLPSAREVYLISPTLWRPVTSILLWYFLASWFFLTALALSYWQLVFSSAKLKLEDSAAAASAEAKTDKEDKKSRSSKRKGVVVRKKKPEKSD